MRFLQHIAHIIQGRSLASLLMVLFVCTSLQATAQVNPFARERRSARTIIRSGQIYTPDSLEVRRADSIRIAKLADTLRKISADSLKTIGDNIRMQLPDSLRKEIFGALQRDSLAVDSLAKDSLTERQRKRLEKRENRTPFISDSMSLRNVCISSIVMPGFGQIYNKQYWKLPILYGTVGASLGLCLWSNSKYKPLKNQFNSITDENLFRTPELNALQSQMIKYNTMRQVFMISTIASYIYFIGDATIKYSTSEVSQVSKATTLSLICPGAGQIYNKSYWRVPIVIGGFATTIYCIDWNNRGYQRFKKAYRLKADYDANPDLYPDGSKDEFAGRYNTSFLKNLRNSYRRNRDLCIILTAGLYILQAIDAHVDAHLQTYDISKDLTVSLSPSIGYSYNRMAPYSGGGTTLGMNLSLTF
ncbi:MAG: hypothetical protein II214_07580 [Alistipes sp.]|nr:hypothetical protein [Alistipes sp.]